MFSSRDDGRVYDVPTDAEDTSAPSSVRALVCVSMLPLGIVARRLVGRGMSDRVCISAERLRSDTVEGLSGWDTTLDVDVEGDGSARLSVLRFIEWRKRCIREDLRRILPDDEVTLA